MAGLEYNSSIFAEYQQLESDVSLARQYEAKATQLLESVDNEDDESEITLKVIRDFEGILGLFKKMNFGLRIIIDSKKNLRSESVKNSDSYNLK